MAVTSVTANTIEVYLIGEGSDDFTLVGHLVTHKDPKGRSVMVFLGPEPGMETKVALMDTADGAKVATVSLKRFQDVFDLAEFEPLAVDDEITDLEFD